MRQVFVLLLVAVFGWWAYGAMWPATVIGGDQGGAPPRTGAAPAGNLDGMLVQPAGSLTTNPPADAAARTAGTSSAPAEAAPAPAPAPAIGELVERLAQADPAARNAGWAAVARGTADAALLAALQPKAADFGSRLAALGTDNAFLHSKEGRALAAAALAAAVALPDAEAVPAGTRLLDLCLRGRIQRGDTDQRAFVDGAYAQYRVFVDRWLCDPANVARARSYTIERGDSLARVASKFRKEKILVEDGTLAVLNRIHNPNAVQVGQKLKVPVDPLYAVVEKRSFSLAVYVGDHLLRLYWVGHGEHDKTPVTEFTVAEKQPRPQWTAPNGEVYPYGHPGNILGEYFIKFRHDSYTGFGAHGTPMPETICTMSSMGCIRMLAPDIAELFKILPRGVRVVVRSSESV